MLRSISRRQFNEWIASAELDPFLDRYLSQRLGWWFASVSQTLVNLNRDHKKHPSGFPLKDFVLRFGDDELEVPKKTQTPKEKFSILRAIALTHARKPKPKPTLRTREKR